MPRAVAAQDEDEGPTVLTAAAANPLPLSGFVRAPTGRWGQGRVREASAKPIGQSGEAAQNDEVRTSRTAICECK